VKNEVAVRAMPIGTRIESFLGPEESGFKSSFDESELADYAAWLDSPVMTIQEKMKIIPAM
jgi:hypothetical protein